MDFGATISRAFSLSWQYKRLWLIALLPAIVGVIILVLFGIVLAGSLGALALSRNTDGLGNALSAGTTVLVCLYFISLVVLLVLFYISMGGLIDGVRQIEEDGRLDVGSAMRAGWQHAGGLFVAGLLLLLPVIAFSCIAGVVIAGFGGLAAAGARGSSGRNAAGGLIAGLYCITLSLYCVLFVYSLVANGIYTLGSREVVLNRAGPAQALSAGWRLFRSNFGNVFLLAIVVIGIQLVFTAVIGAVQQVALAPVFLGVANIDPTSTPDQMLSSLGSLLASGLFSITSILMLLISVVWNILYSVFSSVVWTLAHRQFTGNALLGSGTPPAPPAPLPTA